MSETNSENGIEASPAPRKPGCLKVMFLLFFFSVASVVATVWLIDQLNLGGKIRSGFRDVLGQSSPPVVAPSVPEPKVKIVEKRVEVPVEKIVEKIVEVEVNSPMPSSYIPWQKIDTAKLWNGIRITNSVDAAQGEIASVERKKEDAFELEMKLTFKIPKASRTMVELEKINPHLSEMLPGLSPLLGNAKVSPFYHHLYEKKTLQVQQNVTRLDKVLSVHNLYDTETVLEIENPETQQKALLIQSDMDVVSDGSDGDRWPFLDNYISMSQYYQPFTSYGWAKKTRTPNPLLARWEEDLKKYKDRFAVKGLSAEENRFLRSRIAILPREIEDMKARSYLIAEADPFIVMSLSFLGRTKETPFGPMIGDYAVVIHHDKLYPAIVGDAGPTYKSGEASLRLAKEINPKASPYNRPVSDLEITYLVFPGSREKKNTPPDLPKWHEKCQAYLDKLGGIGEGYELHQWEDIIPRKLAEWEEKNTERSPESILKDKLSATGPGATGETKVVPPAELPKPSFSNPVTPKAVPEEAAPEAEEKADIPE